MYENPEVGYDDLSFFELEDSTQAPIATFHIGGRHEFSSTGTAPILYKLRNTS
jgi:hypothetical protein